jgi:hypothetical protein
MEIINIGIIITIIFVVIAIMDFIFPDKKD